MFIPVQNEHYKEEKTSAADLDRADFSPVDNVNVLQ